mgnify:CR=1 FL=1
MPTNGRIDPGGGNKNPQWFRKSHPTPEPRQQRISARHHKRESVPHAHPVQRPSDACNGRSPGSQVIMFPAFPVSPVAFWKHSLLTVAGAARALERGPIGHLPSLFPFSSLAGTIARAKLHQLESEVKQGFRRIVRFPSRWISQAGTGRFGRLTYEKSSHNCTKFVTFLEQMRYDIIYCE